MRKQLLLISLLSLLGIGGIFLLFHTEKQPNQKPNDFNRIYVRSIKKRVFEITSQDESREIIGCNSSGIFVANLANTAISGYNYNGELFKTENLMIPKRVHHSFSLLIGDSVYTFSGDTNEIFVGSLNAEGISRDIIVPGPIFTKGIFDGHKRYFLRQYFPKIKDQHLITYEPSTDKLHESDGITKQLNDCGMAEEGKLYWNLKGNNLVYVYNKRNLILIIDSNLNLIDSGHTIDHNISVISQAKTIKQRKGYKVTNGAPIYIYNYWSSVENGILYIFSRLKADNEKTDSFNNNCNIDMYDLVTLKYLGSFYLPKFHNRELRSFKIINNAIIASYKDGIASYEL